MAVTPNLNWTCDKCGGKVMDDGADGFFYCRRCGAQAEDIIDTGVADEDFIAPGSEARGALYTASNRRQITLKEEPFSQSQLAVPYQSQLLQSLNLNDDDNENERNKRSFSVKKEELYDYDVDVDYVDMKGPTEPSDFGSGLGGSRNPNFEDYYNEVRMKYVMGVQLMIQFQCEALTEQFGANPLICGLAGTIWMRFVAVSRVFDDDWADESVQDSEMDKPDIPESRKPRARYRVEPHNLYGQRAIMIWYRSLRKSIPLSTSLAVCFLACHVARDKILPTDIVKWSLEGKLPYFAAFLKIEEQIGRPSKACPLGSSLMFRPCQTVSYQKLETMAASIALSLGLNLPPVNFYVIACRYLNELSLPMKNIIQHACRIYEWSMPPELWLSTNESRLPTRVYVMSILIVAVRIIYNLNGFGKWEAALSNIEPSSLSCDHENILDPRCDSETGNYFNRGSGPSFCNFDDSNKLSNNSASFDQKCEVGAGELLIMLEKKYKEIDHTYEYAKDLPKYLKFCKEVAFAGLEPSFDCNEEEKLIEQLWSYYLEEKDVEISEDYGVRSFGETNLMRSRDDDCERPDSLPTEGKRSRAKAGISSQSSVGKSKTRHKDMQNSTNTLKDEAIVQIKSNMEENRFCYIPPRVNVKRLDHLHYVRKRDEGALTFVAHADYYILLRSCAKVAQVDIRIMHIGVLSFERRLAWLEKRIDHCLNFKRPNTTDEVCSDAETEDVMDDTGDCIRLSELRVT